MNQIQTLKENFGSIALYLGIYILMMVLLMLRMSFIQ